MQGVLARIAESQITGNSYPGNSPSPKWHLRAPRRRGSSPICQSHQLQCSVPGMKKKMSSIEASILAPGKMWLGRALHARMPQSKPYFRIQKDLSALAGLATQGAYPVLQARSIALRRTCCIIVCVLAAIQLSSDKTETACRAFRKRPDTPCGWQSCNNPWTAERAADIVMGYCATSSMAPLTSSCISGP